MATTRPPTVLDFTPLMNDLATMGLLPPSTPQVYPQTTGDGGLPPGYGGGTGETPPGFDPKTFGKNDPTNVNLPAGWVVNPGTGGLIPPGTAPTAGGGIGVGELFAVGDTVYRWNGTSITKATVAESKAYFASGGQNIDVNAPNAGTSSGGTDASGITTGTEATQTSTGGAGDPYAANAEARAQAASDRAARAAAINEAMNAIDIQTLRQKAVLAGAQFTAPTDTGGYFPQFGPSSPLVRSGLVDPMKFTPVPYNANVGGDQAAQDLARLRSLAGVG